MPNEKVYALKRAETEDGQEIGDGLIEIGPEHPDYEYWSAYWQRERTWRKAQGLDQEQP